MKPKQKKTRKVKEVNGLEWKECKHCGFPWKWHTYEGSNYPGYVICPQLAGGKTNKS